MRLIHPIIMKIIKDPDVSVGVVLGGRRKGKSVLGYGIIDELYSTKNLETFVLGMPQTKTHLLPSYIQPIQDLDAVPDGSAVIIDEAYREFYARMSMSKRNKFVDTLVALSGQKQLKCIFITQQARRVEVGIAGSADFLLIKKPNLLQMQFDRPQYRNLLVKVHKAFQNLKPPAGTTLNDYQKHCTYVFSEDYVGMVEKSNLAPSWWNQEISRAYAGVSLKDEIEEKTDYTEKQVTKMLANVIAGGPEPKFREYKKYMKTDIGKLDRDGNRMFDDDGKYIPKGHRGKQKIL